MNLISKYLLTNSNERKVLRLATRKLNHNPEEREFFIYRYEPTNSLIWEMKQGGRFNDEIWDFALDASLKECIAEADKIKARKPNYKNMAHNLGLLVIDGTIGSLVTLTGAMGGGVRWTPAERKKQYFEI